MDALPATGGSYEWGHETHIGYLHFKQQSDKIHTLLKSKNYNYLKKFGETSVYENAEG